MYRIFFRFCPIESLGDLKKIPTWYPPIMFFSKNWKSNFTPIFNRWSITKIRFMKKFPKKNFKSFWVVIIGVSKYILNKKIFEKILCQKISYSQVSAIIWDFLYRFQFFEKNIVGGYPVGIFLRWPSDSIGQNLKKIPYM